MQKAWVVVAPLWALATVAMAVAVAGAPAKNAPGVTARCDPDASFRQGAHEYLNNMWGRAKAKGGYEQCLVTRQDGGRTQHGWSWNWPGEDQLGFGFPEIVFGRKPWASASTDTRLPARVGSLEHLNVHFDADTKATGLPVLSLGLWLTNASDARPASIASEIVIWLDFTRDDRPAGSRLNPLAVPGIEGALWLDALHGDRGDGTGWALYSLRLDRPTPRGSLDLLAILERLQAKGWIAPEQYLASVEFGTELRGGAGTTWVRRFEVELATRTAEIVSSTAGAEDADEPISTVTDHVMRIGPSPREDGSVMMSVLMHAQAYFLHPSDPDFAARLELLRFAQAEQRAVTLTFRRSGRLVKVELAPAE